jgi:hypothetical protein
MLGFVALAGCVAPPSSPPRAAPAQIKPPPVVAAPVVQDALPRWRARFPALEDALAAVDFSLIVAESPDRPLPALSPETRSALGRAVESFTLAPGEGFVFARIHGPETPFPDHQPLRMLAAARTVLARVAIAEGDFDRAEALVAAGLAQARAALAAQEGILPLIHSLGVWEAALDGVHALVRSPALPAETARRLLGALQSDASLAQVACERAFRGEYIFVYRVVAERLPQTDDPDLLLSSISSLGMAPPDPLSADVPGLGPTGRLLLDLPATLAAYEADLAPYLAALAGGARFPGGLYKRSTAATLAGYRTELGEFYRYATTNDPPVPEYLSSVRGALEGTANPGGKLLACFMTPPWEVLITTTLRREAQRSALCGLLAWRIRGNPARWSEVTALLPVAPADPFSAGPLLCDPAGTEPRVWSVYQNGQDDGGPAMIGNQGQPADLVWRF